MLFHYGMTAQIVDAWTRACRAYELARLEHERAVLAMRRAYSAKSSREECAEWAQAEERAFGRVQATLAVMRYFARACAESCSASN
jgi:hypothetical protein